VFGRLAHARWSRRVGFPNPSVRLPRRGGLVCARGLSAGLLAVIAFLDQRSGRKREPPDGIIGRLQRVVLTGAQRRLPRPPLQIDQLAPQAIDQPVSAPS